MIDISGEIKKHKIEETNIDIYWLGGASFLIRSKKKIIGIDLYLSDDCRKSNDEYKRLVPPIINPINIELDYLIATHEHADHLDISSLVKFINPDTKTVLAGPKSVMDIANNIGSQESKLRKLDRYEEIDLNGITLEAVYADHGEYSVDAIGLIIKIYDKNIYFTGDTCYRYDLPELIFLKEKVDILIVPINGNFGNPDPKDAAYITSWVNPEIVIPCHFGLFKEQGGNPGEFNEYCKEISPGTTVRILTVGEPFTY